MKTLLASLLCLLLLAPAYGQRPNLSKPEKNFEAFWHTFDEHYAHFATRKVDWPQQYARFRPQVTGATTDEELWNILHQMVEPLRDGHVVISRTGELPASAKYSAFHQAFPSKEAVEQLQAVVAQTSAELGFGEYVRFKSKNYRIGGYAASDKYGYLQLHGFGGMPLPEFEKQLDEMLTRFTDKKAVIVDIRMNGGGSPDFVRAVVSRFIAEKVLASYGQRREGPGAEQFTPPSAYYIEPHARHLVKPLILLTNGSSISAADHGALNLKGLPYVTLVGEHTAGMFSSMLGKKLPNGWQYALSNEKVLSREQVCYEGVGVPVDVTVANTAPDIPAGKDPVLVKAVEFLNAAVK